jgi:hypothetical protein
LVKAQAALALLTGRASAGADDENANALAAKSSAAMVAVGSPKVTA